MNLKNNNVPKDKEEKLVENSTKTKKSYPQPQPEKPSNEEIRRQLGWHLK